MQCATEGVNLELFQLLIKHGANFIYPGMAKPEVIRDGQKALEIRISQFIYYCLLKQKVIDKLSLNDSLADVVEDLGNIINDIQLNDSFVAQSKKDFQATHEKIVQKLKAKMNDKDIKASDSHKVIMRALAFIACIIVIPAFFFIHKGYRDAVFRPSVGRAIKKKAELVEHSRQLVAARW